MYEFLERARWASGALAAVALACGVAFAAMLVQMLGLPWVALPVLVVLAGVVLAMAYVYGDRGVLRTLGPKVSEHPLRAKAKAALDGASLCIGVPAPPIALLDLAAVNVGVVGHEQTDSVLVTTTMTVNTLRPDELLAVFARELAYVRRGDTAAATMTWAVARIGRFLAYAAALLLLEIFMLVGVRAEANAFVLALLPIVAWALFVWGVAVGIGEIAPDPGEDGFSIGPWLHTGIGRAWLWLAVGTIAVAAAVSVHTTPQVQEIARSDAFAELSTSLAQAAVLCVVGGVAARLAEVGYMRGREYVADAAAALATREPAALTMALSVMDAHLNCIPSAHGATVHMFTMDTQCGVRRPFLEAHPSALSRLERLQKANPSDSRIAEIVDEYKECVERAHRYS